MPEKKREGGQPKDKVLMDGFNTKKRNNLSQALLRKAKLEKARQDNEKRKAERDLQALEDQVKLARQAMGKAPKEKVDIPDSDDNPANPEDDVKSAYQMLQDMRWVYKNVKGRQRLKELCADDKQFLFMVKELMKIEAGLMSAKIKRNEDGDGGGQTTVFVVMKGLVDDIPSNPVTKKSRVIDVGGDGDGGEDDQAIDFKQISHMLNPEAPPYEEPREIEPVVEGPKLDW